MQDLTAESTRKVEELATRHNLSASAVKALLDAIRAGGGRMAQFNHPELGGMGQWSHGGMTMIGEMSNNDLKLRVDTLCNDLATMMENEGAPLPYASLPSQHHELNSDLTAESPAVSLFAPRTAQSDPGQWWSAELGSPSSTGAQNDIRYAFFPTKRRLVIQVENQLSVYDTGDHQITGFSQRQGRDQSLTFTSQHGLISVSDLARVDPNRQ
jgi:hypothetical protein